MWPSELKRRTAEARIHTKESGCRDALEGLPRNPIIGQTMYEMVYGFIDPVVFEKWYEEGYTEGLENPFIEW
jgi:hypothetical protein